MLIGDRGAIRAPAPFPTYCASTPLPQHCTKALEYCAPVLQTGPDVRPAGSCCVGSARSASQPRLTARARVAHDRTQLAAAFHTPSALLCSASGRERGGVPVLIWS